MGDAADGVADRNNGEPTGWPDICRFVCLILILYLFDEVSDIIMPTREEVL